MTRSIAMHAMHPFFTSVGIRGEFENIFLHTKSSHWSFCAILFSSLNQTFGQFYWPIGQYCVLELAVTYPGLTLSHHHHHHPLYSTLNVQSSSHILSTPLPGRWVLSSYYKWGTEPDREWLARQDSNEALPASELSHLATRLHQFCITV